MGYFSFPPAPPARTSWLRVPDLVPRFQYLVSPPVVLAIIVSFITFPLLLREYCGDYFLLRRIPAPSIEPYVYNAFLECSCADFFWIRDLVIPTHTLIFVVRFLFFSA